jgi:hypothetical protein
MWNETRTECKAAVLLESTNRQQQAATQHDVHRNTNAEVYPKRHHLFRLALEGRKQASHAFWRRCFSAPAIRMEMSRRATGDEQEGDQNDQRNNQRGHGLA